MPMLIKHIDAIGREKQRDVLFVVFKLDEDDEDHPWLDWDNLPIRQHIIDWLEKHGICWAPCGEYANVNQMVSYMGQIYIDLPYDRTLPSYLELEAFLENPDGSMRFPHVIFAYLPLESAMKNAEHDAPGFWERWAASF